jgi:hypothetical protein
VVINGLTYHWCSRHTDPEGRWNGLYVRHEEKDHDAAVAKNKERFRKKSGGANKPSDSGGGGGNNLVVSQRLKEVLCGRLMLDDEDADKICADILNQGKY